MGHSRVVRALIPRYLTASELAERLSVSETWCMENLPSHRWNGVRRFREDEVLARLAELEGREDNVRQIREVAG